MTARGSRRWSGDLRWGLLRGLFFGALAVAPATIALVSGLASPSEGGVSTFLKWVAAYCAFGAVAGVLAGVFRPQLRVRTGATVFGAFLGVLGAVSLILADPSESGFVVSDWAFLVLGAFAGAIVGWFAWGSFQRHGLLKR